MSEKVGPVGGDQGQGCAFNDGVFDGVKKIIVSKEGIVDCLSYIKIEYGKDGKFETHEHGTIRGALQEFSVDYPNEYITSIGGGYGYVKRYDQVMIKSLIFKTTYGRTSPVLGATTPSGKPAGTEFMLEGKNGGKLIGFLGRSGEALDALGAYFGPLLPPAHATTKFGPIGGNKGNTFDDGVFDGVKKITVAKEGGVFNCISYIKIEYKKDGKLVTREHGTIRGGLQEFSVDYPNEYITSVGGSYDHVKYYETVLIKSLIFKTTKGRTSPVLGGTTPSGKPAGTEFILESKNGGKLLGFHGRSGQALDALGAYFGPLLPPAHATTKFGPIGGNKGNTFDDGVFDGVKKITVGKDVYSITYVKIEYEKDGNVEIREHGKNGGELEEFSVDDPKEYITAVGGSYNHIFNYDTTLITSLYFTTSKGFTSPLFGETRGEDFNLKGENGGKLLGFHGRAGDAIDAIGAFFETSSRRSQKLGPIGGSKGNRFDDGVFNGVKKVIVGKDEYSVTYIKMEYANDGKFETREHGTVRGELEEFSVDYPNEYITGVGGSYNHIFNYDTTLITSLFFKTSKGFTSPLFGEMAGPEFMLEGTNGGKLLGLNGRGGVAIDAIGAHFDI